MHSTKNRKLWFKSGGEAVNKVMRWRQNDINKLSASLLYPITFLQVCSTETHQMQPARKVAKKVCRQLAPERDWSDDDEPEDTELSNCDQVPPEVLAVYGMGALWKHNPFDVFHSVSRDLADYTAEYNGLLVQRDAMVMWPVAYYDFASRNIDSVRCC